MVEYKDFYYMQRALQISALAKGSTSPNPMVGCVIVKNGNIIAEGYHQKAGLPHAEIIALNQAGENAENSDIYVTLEPCSHFGKTPPCVDAIIKAKPRRVIVAMIDPNPLVSGKGIQKLKDAGIHVEVGLLEEKAKKLNEVFIKYITTNVPFVITKWAMTLDGKIATVTGESKYISSIQTLQWVHSLRNEVDAIMIGGHTAIIDNPSLTVRWVPEKEKKPVRIVLDTYEGLPDDLNLFQQTDVYPTWVITSYDRKYPKASKTIKISTNQHEKYTINSILQILGSQGITSILIEGGTKTLTSAFQENIVDKLFCIICPKIFGGLNAPTPIAGDGIAKYVTQGMPLEITKVLHLDPDVVIEAYPMKGERPCSQA